MIKLVVNPDSSPVEHLFYKEVIIIGCADFPETDLSLPGENLDQIHIKILFRDGKYIAMNQANDPFVSINGLPFGKKTLHDNDLLQIGKTLIRIHPETVAPAPVKESWGDTAHEIPDILEKTLSEKKARPAPTSVKELQSEEYADLDIDELVRQVELLEAQNAFKAPPEKEDAKKPVQESIIEEDADDHPVTNEPKIVQSLKDDYLKYLDDDTEIEIDKFMSRKGQSAQKLPAEDKSARVNLFVKLFLIIIILAAIFLSYWYYMLLERSQQEELKAARAVADISMALNYSNFYQVRPLNQNWSDPEFLKSNLQAILSKHFKSMVSLDQQGRFNNTPYILRIYTSTDLTQFLVLAQPAPSWEQWVVPKHSIAVSLSSMEVRKTNDLRVLNRILLHTETLDGNSHHEIDAFLRQNEMIPLKDLATKEGNQGFAPPSALGLFRPGAENLIYNAPRYYLFGESFINRAIDLANNPDSVHEIGLFRSQVEKLSRFQDVVLYSSNGLKMATEAKKAIGVFLPNSSVSIAYLQYNSKGAVMGSHLLFENAQNEIAASDFFAANDKSAAVIVTDEASDALSMQLQALAKERQATLGPITNEMVEMIQQELTSPGTDFKDRFKLVFKRYSIASSTLNKKISERIVELEQEYAKIPLCDFLHKAEVYGLEKIAQPVLEKTLTPEELSCKNNDFEALLKDVDDATNLTTLYDAVKAATKFLGIDTIPDTQRLISYQGYAKGHVQKKLSHLLLSVDSVKAGEKFTKKNRALLLSILEMAWITDPDEIHYYLQEFDMHLKEPAIEPVAEVEAIAPAPRKPRMLQLGKKKPQSKPQE